MTWILIWLATVLVSTLISRSSIKATDNLFDNGTQLLAYIVIAVLIPFVNVIGSSVLRFAIWYDTVDVSVDDVTKKIFFIKDK